MLNVSTAMLLVAQRPAQRAAQLSGMWKGDSAEVDKFLMANILLSEI